MRIVIVGGGSAGWLTAGILASEFPLLDSPGVEVTLIESPDVATIGVGEGTWPSMPQTLERIGVSEADFLGECDASFKQGTRFAAWTTGQDDVYYHPFSWPHSYQDFDLAPFWLARHAGVRFADAVSPQSQVCECGLAPKQATTPEYAYILNYGYHLDAGKFSKFLEKQCVGKLGVRHVLDNVTAVNSAENGDIASLVTQNNDVLEGELFIDCTGFASLLMGRHYGIGYRDKKALLFNDTALAMQVPRETSDEPIASATLSTGQRAGWIWDIGLPTRRGVGYVHSSAYISEEEAEQDLRNYVAQSVGRDQAESLPVRKIDFRPGYRYEFWHRNCVAVGLSAGFVEPLEASALALIELSARTIADQLPANRAAMNVVAARFNEKMRYQWQRIMEFLKLHYALSKRTDSEYWRDNTRLDTMPGELRGLLELWRTQGPYHQDTPRRDSLFPSASYQYVLYGMDYDTDPSPYTRRLDAAAAQHAERLLADNAQRTRQLLDALPTNRDLLNRIEQSRSGPG